MTRELLLETVVYFERGQRGSKLVTSVPVQPSVQGRLPRITRLMALAIHFDPLVRDGEIHDNAEQARLGHLTRARVTQIMNLTNLAPEIHEEILFLPKVAEGREHLVLRQFQKMAGLTCWRRQRRAWRELLCSES
jgi:hypothetical protein